MFGPSSGVVHELWRIISNKKMGKCFAGTALCRSWMAYHHGYMLAKQVAYLKALGRDTSLFS